MLSLDTVLSRQQGWCPEKQLNQMGRLWWAASAKLMSRPCQAEKYIFWHPKKKNIYICPDIFVQGWLGQNPCNLAIPHIDLRRGRHIKVPKRLVNKVQCYFPHL